MCALSLTGDPSALPGVPRAMSYAKDDRVKRLALIETLSEIGRLTAGPPGMPANILDAEQSSRVSVSERSPGHRSGAGPIPVQSRF